MAVQKLTLADLGKLKRPTPAPVAAPARPSLVAVRQEVEQENGAGRPVKSPRTTETIAVPSALPARVVTEALPRAANAAGAMQVPAAVLREIPHDAAVERLAGLLPVTLTNWRPKPIGMFIGFATVRLACGVLLHELYIYRRNDMLSVEIPSRVKLDRNGMARRTPDGVTIQYTKVVSFPDEGVWPTVETAILHAVAAADPTALTTVVDDPSARNKRK